MATAQTQNYYDQQGVGRDAREREHSRSLKRAQQQSQYEKNLAGDLKNRQQASYPRTDAQKKQELRQRQQRFSQKFIKDPELQDISDDVTDVFTSSPTMLPVNITKIAFDSRQALTDWISKWWVVAFYLAALKDAIIDPTVITGPLIGWPLQIYFFIFLFGGGFVRKRLKKTIAKMLILFIIGFIPIVNIIIPETLLAVFLRWDSSKKAAEKGNNNLKRIKEAYSEFDV